MFLLNIDLVIKSVTWAKIFFTPFRLNWNTCFRNQYQYQLLISFVTISEQSVECIMLNDHAKKVFTKKLQSDAGFRERVADLIVVVGKTIFISDNDHSLHQKSLY